MSKLKICPLLLATRPLNSALCGEDSCAWWDPLSGSCCIRAAVGQSKHSKKDPASVTSTDRGKKKLPFLPPIILD